MTKKKDEILRYLNTQRIQETASEMLDGGGCVSAIEVAARLLPDLVLACAAVMENDSNLRIGDSQDDIPYMGVYFVED